MHCPSTVIFCWSNLRFCDKLKGFRIPASVADKKSVPCAANILPEKERIIQSSIEKNKFLCGFFVIFSAIPKSAPGSVTIMQDITVFLFMGGAMLILILLLLLAKAFLAHQYPYQTKPILTKREYQFYMMLRRETDRRGLLICPKVGLKDLLAVSTKKNYMKYFRLIAQKHMDFVVCDQNLRVLFAIELDDSSHDTKDARKRDHFKDQAFRAAKIPLKRIRNFDETAVRNLFR